MKANELMIGDWVLYNGISNKISLADFGIDEGHTKWRNEIKPIPLTPEILEKNGFKKGKYCYEFKERLVGYMGQTVSTTTPIEINYYEEGHCVIMNPHIGKDFRGSILYVHELQHALRLCEIDNEIKL